MLESINRRATAAVFLTACAALGLTACGDDAFTPPGEVAKSAKYTVGGMAIGLAGTVVLQDNGGDNLSLTANGSFAFGTALDDGTAYNVSVLTQPSGQTCSVGAATGTVTGANVTGTGVSCMFNETAASLNATYANIVYDPAEPGSSLFMTTMTDGNYTASGNNANINGTIAGPTALPSGTYSVTAAGDLTITPTGGAPVTGGVLGVDAGAFVQMDMNAGTPAGFGVGVRQGSGMTQAAVAGNYTLVRFTATTGSSEDDLETLTLDSSGNYNATVTTNVSGTIAPATDSGAISVASGGTLTSSDGFRVGAVSEDGDLVALQEIQSGHPPAVIFGVKRGTGVTTATVNGIYVAVGYGGVVPGSASAGALFNLVVDGQGNFTAIETSKVAGTTSTSTITGTYAVQSDGTLTLVSGNTWTGAVSADGNVVVLTDVTSGDSPAVIVALRE